MAGPSTGSGLIFNSTASTSGVVTPAVDVKQFLMTSFQTKTDGTQTLTVDVQVTNVPAPRDNYGATVPARDDSFASADWVTVSTNAMAAAAASRMDVVAYATHKYARVRLTSGAGTPTVKVFVQQQGNE